MYKKPVWYGIMIGIVCFFSLFIISASAYDYTGNPIVIQQITSTDYSPEICDKNPSIKNDMGMNQLWDLGWDGSGVRIGIIDTGIDSENPYFDGDQNLDTIEDYRVVDHYNFVGETQVTNGHGSEIAGLLISTHAQVNNFEFSGLVEGAKLIDFQALDREGYGTTTTIIAALQQAIDLNQDGNPNNDLDIINLSFGMIGNDPAIEAKVIEAWNTGIVVVCAGGNEGMDDYGNTVLFSVNSPGSALEPISVGAMYDETQIPKFSSIGPVPYTYLVKPEVVAPGTYLITVGLHSNFYNISGTSYSAPIVAGGIALVLDGLNRNGYAKPTPDQIKSALIESATSLGYNEYIQGAGVPDFKLMYDILVAEQPRFTLLPKYLEFPNYFDWEREEIGHFSAEDTIANVGSVAFPYYKVTGILTNDMTTPIAMEIIGDIGSVIQIINDTTIQNAGQYVVGVDFIQSTNPFQTTYTGSILFKYDNMIIAELQIIVFTSFWGNIQELFATWYGEFLMIFTPIGTIFLCGFVSKKGKKKINNPILDRCPPDAECVYDPVAMKFKIIKSTDI